MEVFDPVQFSVQENQFLQEFIGTPPTVAMRVVPGDVNPKAVRPVIDRVYQLIEEEKHTGQKWCGVDALRGAIALYLEKQGKWRQDRRRGAPRYPSMSSYDGRGRPHYQGVGSDSGQVRTYIDERGKRVPFAVEFIPVGMENWAAEWIGVDESKSGIIVDNDKLRIECGICGHTESFKSDSRSSYNAARGRISKHLRNAKVEKDAHMEVHTLEFGSSKVV